MESNQACFGRRTNRNLRPFRGGLDVDNNGSPPCVVLFDRAKGEAHVDPVSAVVFKTWTHRFPRQVYSLAAQGRITTILEIFDFPREAVSM